MRIRTTLTHGATALALTTTALVGTVAAAESAAARPECEGTGAKVGKETALWRPADQPAFKSGPGGTMTVTVQKTSTLVATFGTTVESEIGALFAKIKGSVSVSVTKSLEITQGLTYSRDLPEGKYGNIAYGAWGYKVPWTIHKMVNGPRDGKCIYGPVIKRGVTKVPENSVGWKVWFTKT